MVWGYYGDAWEATVFVDATRKEYRCVVSNMTEEKWAVVDAIHGYGVPFAEAHRVTKKRAARDYMENELVGLYGRMTRIRSCGRGS